MRNKFILCLLFVFVLLQSIVGVEPFCFALITDTHIAKGTSAAEDLENTVQHINESPKVEFVLVTGDITEEGDIISLKKAKSILDKLNVKYYAIPGNHETKWSASGGTDFGRVFGSERFEFKHKGVLFLGFNTGPILRMSDGHVSAQDIVWIQAELKKTGKESPVILATHYPLQNGDVDNWFEVTDIVRKHNVRAVIGGHYHRNAIFSYDGIPGLIHRSNLRSKEKVGGYSIYQITPDSIKVSEQIIGEKPREWAALSMKKKYYEEQGSKEKYPSFQVNNDFTNVKEKWKVKTNTGIYTSPVVFGKNVYVGDDAGNLTCYNLKNGRKKWTFSSGNRIIGTPDALSGMVVFGSADKNIYGLNASNGKLIWKLETQEPVLGAVSIEKNIAYVGGSDGCFRAINIFSGEEIWKFSEIKNYIETKPLVADGKVIFGAWDTFLYALDKNTGKEIWRWTNGMRSMHYSPAAVWSVATNSSVFVADPERAITAIDIKTGKTVWRTKTSMARESIGISNNRKQIYAKTMQDSVVCYSAVTNVPKEIWSVNVGFGYEHNPSMLVEKDSTVLGSTKNGLIFALKADTGEVLWKYKTGNTPINTVVPLDKNRVLFSSIGGELGMLLISK